MGEILILDIKSPPAGRQNKAPDIFVEAGAQRIQHYLAALMLDDAGKLLIQTGYKHSNNSCFGVFVGKFCEFPSLGLEESK